MKYDDRGSVNVVDLAGKVEVLSDGYWGLEGLGWMPDGNEIVFSAGTGYSNFEIFRTELAGVTRPALQSAGGLTFHTVLPDGRWLVTRDDNQRGMLGLAPGESQERDLTWLELSEPAALSRDGKTLLFTEEGTAAGLNYAVCLRGTDGSPVIRLGDGFAADLSPDGRWALACLFGTPSQALLYPTGAGEPMVLERGALEEYRDGKFFPDAKRVLLEASEAGHAPRCYVQDLAGGAPRPVTPEGTSRCALGPDGERVLAMSVDRSWWLYPVTGGEAVPVRGILPDELVSRVDPDGRSVVVYERGRMPARVTRVDLVDGSRTTIREIAPPDLTGALAMSPYVMDETGRSYAYSYFRHLSQMFIVDGVR